MTLLDVALEYAAHAWHVFPLHTPKPNGTCDCNRSDCTSIGKHPRTLNGFKDATADPEKIRQWWTGWPKANIGLACEASKLIVMDVDPRNGGDESFRDLLQEYGEGVQETVTAITGSGGQHYYYRMPPGGFRPGKNVLGPGIDLPSYVVAPPSLHASGNHYEWERAPGENERTVYPFKDKVAPRQEGKHERLDTAAILAGVPEGKRDDMLFRMAAKLRWADVPHDLALQLIEEAARNCQPPFPVAEARKKVNEAYRRYEAGKSVIVSVTELPTYANLRKHETEPPTYELAINGQDVRLSTAQVLDHGKLTVAAFEQLNVILPFMAPASWKEQLKTLIDEMAVIDAPEDASESGIIWATVKQFLATHRGDTLEDVGTRPVQNEVNVYVTGTMLRRALKERNVIVEQRKLWGIVRSKGAINKTVRVGEKVVRVWAIPLAEVDA